MAKRLLNEELGELTGRLVQEAVKGIVPGLNIAELESFKRLTEGELEAAKRLGTDLRSLLKQRAGLAAANPFYGEPKEVARSLCGATVSYVRSVGNVKGGLIIEGGLITKVAAYTGEADNFPLRYSLPGTIGVWIDPRRGGYSVACIAAHPDESAGYVAILGLTIGDRRLGMAEAAERLAFEELSGQNVTERHSELIISPHGPAMRKVTKDLHVREIDHHKLGKDCIAAYEVKQL